MKTQTAGIREGFLASLAGNLPQDGDLRTILENFPRLEKYLFVELLFTPSLVEQCLTDQILFSHLQKALRWYSSYRSMFVYEGLGNDALDSLLGTHAQRSMSYVRNSRGLRPKQRITSTDWREDRRTFFKGLSWKGLL